ncbi:MAG: hypothetical protein EAZ85_00515 [Bacteroidetes bacterium]|nr:MAG: hypothetical protein EAZ85_00515 [Bacteroidota bacterium]TAG89349.1 MAG: hypothetical protein EAZ20_06655 [Bacteroidota bacterium]
MKLDKIILENYRGFEKEEIFFSESNINVFIGINGAGKTSLLDAIVYNFELWIESNFKVDISAKKFYDKWGSIDILDYVLPFFMLELKKNAKLGKIHTYFNQLEVTEIEVTFDEQAHHVIIGSKNNFQSFLLAELFENENYSIPIFAYYTTFQFFDKKEQDKSKNVPKIKQLNAYQNICTYLSDYHLFEKWFKNQEDYENQEKIRLKNLDYRNPSLEVVRKVIEIFFQELGNPFFNDLKIQRFENESFDFKDVNQNFSLVINKNDIIFHLDELSSGEKNLLLLICDIARRLSIANPMFSIEEILEKGEGIVLIDEIEQHLHPKWQRNILSALEKTFPNIQFIVTTHSPQVLSGTKKENVFILDNFKVSQQKPYVEGRDSNSILEDAFNFSKYSPEIKSKIDDFYHFLQNNIEKAEEILNSIKEKFGEFDLEVKRATMYLEDEKEDLE